MVQCTCIQERYRRRRRRYTTDVELMSPVSIVSSRRRRSGGGGGGISLDLFEEKHLPQWSAERIITRITITTIALRRRGR